jgi:Ca-activated chloride channel family protein
MRSLVFFVLTFSTATAMAGDGPRLLENRRVKTPEPSANLRVDVNMTLVPVTVLDVEGRNITGLRRENFRVFDENQQRPIVSFGGEDAPVSVGLVFDSSRSMTDKFKTARLAPQALFDELNPEDESFLVTVSDRAHLRQPFTSMFSEIQNALLFSSPAGTTSLLDGAYMGLSELKHARNPRKALIIVSDGGENTSRYTLHELASMAAESDAQIFAICLYQNPQSDEEQAGPGLLTRLAQVSGGANFLTSNVNDLQKSMRRIGISLHHQYVLGYHPPEDVPSGKYRKLKVQVLVPANTPKLHIYARAGYYAPDK